MLQFPQPRTRHETSAISPALRVFPQWDDSSVGITFAAAKWVCLLGMWDRGGHWHCWDCRFQLPFAGMEISWRDGWWHVIRVCFLRITWKCSAKLNLPILPLWHLALRWGMAPLSKGPEMSYLGIQHSRWWPQCSFVSANREPEVSAGSKCSPLSNDLRLHHTWVWLLTGTG